MAFKRSAVRSRLAPPSKNKRLHGIPWSLFAYISCLLILNLFFLCLDCFGSCRCFFRRPYCTSLGKVVGQVSLGGHFPAGFGKVLGGEGLGPGNVELLAVFARLHAVGGGEVAGQGLHPPLAADEADDLVGLERLL